MKFHEFGDKENQHIMLIHGGDVYKRQRQGRHNERLTDQRQRELPVPMSDQPQLQAFQRRVLKKCRKSNVLPQRPLQR